MAQWLLITSVVFLASTLQSMTGFRFAVLAVPLLVPLLPPRDDVALITVLSTATTVLAWWRIRAETAPGWTWRLFTAGFLHGGIIHIAVNMWCLWSLGHLSERLFGKWQTFIIYMLTGVGGALRYPPAAGVPRRGRRGRGPRGCGGSTRRR